MNLRLTCACALLLGLTFANPAVAEPAPSAVSEAAHTATDFLLIPDHSAGPITRDSTEASLKVALGADNVKAEMLYVGDGQDLPGLAIFPDDPSKRVEVIWSEDEPLRPMFVQLYGDSSVWKTKEGVSLGTSLQELEKLNGRPFVMYGMGWDFGGTVLDWKGGALEGLNVRLAETEDQNLTGEEIQAISGEQQIQSDSPVLQRVNPKVFKMVIFLNPSTEDA